RLPDGTAARCRHLRPAPPGPLVEGAPGILHLELDRRYRAVLLHRFRRHRPAVAAVGAGRFRRQNGDGHPHAGALPSADAGAAPADRAELTAAGPLQHTRFSGFSQGSISKGSKALSRTALKLRLSTQWTLASTTRSPSTMRS